MQALTERGTQEITLEAPGDFLSGLLAVCEASVFALREGAVRTVPAEAGRWHVLLKLSASPEAERFCAALTDLAREPRQEMAEVFFEYNPATMM